MIHSQQDHRECEARAVTAFSGLACQFAGMLMGFVLILVSGCSTHGRQMGTKSVVQQESRSQQESRDVTGSKDKRAEPAGQGRKPEVQQKTPHRETEARSARTEVERVRDMAIDLAEKHAPVREMKLCHAKKSGEWWITLFREEGHAYDLKQYVWSTRNDKLAPFCVEKRIVRENLDDYLNETVADRECTAFERTNKGWTLLKARPKGGRGASNAPETLKGWSTRTVDLSPVFQDVPPISVMLVSSNGVGRPAANARGISTPQGVADDYVFVYGSEMNHTDLLNWLRCRGYDPCMVVHASPAKLEGYDFVWNYFSQAKGGGTANIEPRKVSVVWGVLLEVDDRLIAALDRKQGSPVTYCRGRKRIPVRRIEDDRTVLAWVYTAKPNRNGRTNIWPTPEYKKGILDAASFWGFPRPYVDRIRNWNTSR